MSEMIAQGLRLQLTMIVVGAVIWPGIAARAQTYVPFEGAKKDWHGYDRYDFLMDEQTLEITPYTAGADEGNGIQGRFPANADALWWSPKNRQAEIRGHGEGATGTISRKRRWNCSSRVFISPTSRPITS
jgi:hypothetical protein